MSTLVDRLQRLGQIERSGFGFGASAQQKKVPTILVGVIRGDNDSVTEDSPDFLVLDSCPDTTQIASLNKQQSIWGMFVGSDNRTKADQAGKIGADFLIVIDESAPASIILENDLANGFLIDRDINKHRAKAIDAIGFDFFILDGKSVEMPLTIRSVLDIQEQLTRYSAHALLRLDQIPDAESLEIFRDLGISGILLNDSELKDGDLKSLRSTIADIQPKKSNGNVGASLPNSEQLADTYDEFEEDSAHQQH